MQENSETTRDRQLDEELADVLIAISVIAKRLARKLQTANQEGGTIFTSRLAPPSSLTAST